MPTRAISETVRLDKTTTRRITTTSWDRVSATGSGAMCAKRCAIVTAHVPVVPVLGITIFQGPNRPRQPKQSERPK
jgi:hypothetical protein